MRRTHSWLEKHGGKLLLLLGVSLLANGIAGHLNGVETALQPDGRYPGKIAQTPVWMLDFIGLVLLVYGIVLIRQKARKTKRPQNRASDS